MLVTELIVNSSGSGTEQDEIEERKIGDSEERDRSA